MAFDLRQLNKLKLKMTEEKQISDVFTYFFDHFGENEEFLKLGKPKRHELVEQVVGKTVGNLLKLKNVAVMYNFLLIHIPEQSFYHGGCMIGGKMVMIIYFDDIQMGCISVAMSFQGGKTQFVRFSTVATSDPKAMPKSN
ncbi:MAG: hypothetical protein MUD01_26770 [Chloroflexaceae bacterium]|jgi:hypothetical protein|nr:hypothetical protein [Chloroflexaceae bacterium]